MKSLLSFLLIASAAPGFVHAQPAAVPFAHQSMGVANGCFVESVVFGDDYRARYGEDGWYRVLQWGAKDDEEVVAGHAVTVFEHQRRLWSYDINRGFTVLATPVEQREEVALVAKEVTAPYAAKITPRYPVYREDFRRQPEPGPAPAPFTEVEERDLRDAGVAAERLARHRAVALLEFTYPKDGDVKRGAAAAFLYHGRLCVYSPPKGTVPFRVQAQSLRNLRQLQELVRRMYPGASNLRAR